MAQPGGLPMPPEFHLMSFDDPNKAPKQIEYVVKWIVTKNGLWNLIEMVSIKYPFAHSVGPQETGAGQPPFGKDAAAARSAANYINQLRKIPNIVAVQTAVQLDDFLSLWVANRTESGNALAFGYDHEAAGRFPLGINGRGLGFTQHDARIANAMAPEGRLEMVVAAAENIYAIQLRLVQSKHPISNLFDPYLEQGVQGRAGTSISLAH